MKEKYESNEPEKKSKLKKYICAGVAASLVLGTTIAGIAAYSCQKSDVSIQEIDKDLEKAQPGLLRKINDGIRSIFGK